MSNHRDPVQHQQQYGWPHRRARAQALALLQPGDPCSRCGKAMHPTQRLDLDHTDDRTGYRGLAHAHCNRAAGAIRGNRIRGNTGQATTTVTSRWNSRAW
jgi:hypothetical protein